MRAPNSKPAEKRLGTGSSMRKLATANIFAEASIMGICKKIAPGLVACTSTFLACGLAQAGPCTTDISQFESTIQQTRGDPGAGLSAPQSVDAQLGHQPTQNSVRQAEHRLHSKFAARMARAKLLDQQGDPGCVNALRAAKRLYVP
jgi:hypothetical protein